MAWNGSAVESSNQSKTSSDNRRVVSYRPCICHGIIAGSVCLIGTAIALWLMLSDQEIPTSDEVSKSVGKIAEAEPVTTLSTMPAQTSENQEVVASNRYEAGVEVVSSTVITNTSGAVIEKLELANGKKMSKVHPPKPIFENAAEQVIALAISVKPGQSMPPLPMLDKSLERDFLDSLASPIRIKDDDSDEVKDLKARVLETKAYIVDEIKKGGSLLEVLRLHQEEMARNSDAHLMALQEVQKLRAEAGDEAADEFIDQINESFRARGIAELEKGKSSEARRTSK